MSIKSILKRYIPPTCEAAGIGISLACLISSKPEYLLIGIPLAILGYATKNKITYPEIFREGSKQTFRENYNGVIEQIVEECIRS